MNHLLPRLLLAIAMLAGLLALLYWHHDRSRRIADCISAGGDWEGPASRCRMPPGRLLIRPDFSRG
jgi:hypothetical protein